MCFPQCCSEQEGFFLCWGLFRASPLMCPPPVPLAAGAEEMSYDLFTAALSRGIAADGLQRSLPTLMTVYLSCRESRMPTVSPLQRHLMGQRFFPPPLNMRSGTIRKQSSPKIITLPETGEIRWPDLCVLWLHPAWTHVVSSLAAPDVMQGRGEGFGGLLAQSIPHVLQHSLSC